MNIFLLGQKDEDSFRSNRALLCSFRMGYGYWCSKKSAFEVFGSFRMEASSDYVHDLVIKSMRTEGDL